MDIQNLAGTRLGNYEIEHLLGRGGMGVVYRARQTSLDRPVALKILPPTLSSDASFIKRFRREARAVAQLDHPNIIQIFDIAEDAGLHFFSMQYVEGSTLDKVLSKHGRMDVDEAVGIILQAAQGIEHAHRNGIIHRDIKPANIMVTADGQAKIMDFGLAKLSDRTRITKTATVMGTVDYMSPEQARGDDINHRTDIWSLGVLLYEMLVGRPPFKGHTEQAVIYSILHEVPHPITSLRSEIPPRLEQVVLKMMEKAVEDRHQNMETVITDLESIQSELAASVIPGEQSSPSIVVLPFVNIGEDKEQEYFCDGLSEELINALAQLQDVRVVARTSAFSFKGEKLDVRDIGRKLGVETVLEGSVRKAGKKLRITAQLINVADGYHLWSERYDREMDDVFAIQDEITMAIVDRLKPKLLKEEKAKVGKRQTVSLEAYNLYLRGRWFWNKRTAEGLWTAIEYFNRAIQMAPDYAAAYAGLADSYVVIPTHTPFPPKEVLPKAREAALKAVELDDSLAEAHSSLGMVKQNYWDWEGAEQEYKRAIELSPGYAPAHMWYGMLLIFKVRIDEALLHIRQAFELDPLSLQINTLLTQAYLWARQYDRAIEAARKTIEMEPSYPNPYVLLGFAYFLKGMQAEAIAQFQATMKLSKGSNPVMEAYVGLGYAFTDKRDEARQILDSLLERSKDMYFAHSVVARLLFVLGERDQAFEWLDRALEANDNFLRFLKVEESLGFYDIASDPRFGELLKKIGLE